MVVQSVQYLRTQLSQVFVQILALQLDTQLHHLPKQTLMSLNVRFSHYYVVFYTYDSRVSHHNPLYTCINWKAMAAVDVQNRTRCSKQ